MNFEHVPGPGGTLLLRQRHPTAGVQDAQDGEVHGRDGGEPVRPPRAEDHPHAPAPEPHKDPLDNRRQRPAVHIHGVRRERRPPHAPTQGAHIRSQK